MKRPTCTGSIPTATAGDSGRWLCDGMTPMPPAQQLALRLAQAADLDALRAVLVAVEHAAIHCRIDDDQAVALRSLHGRRYSILRRREMQASGLYRSITLLLRSGISPAS